MDHNITELVTRLVLQLAVILIVAKIAGEVTERFLKQPGVLGELVGGIIIGPYALGGFSFPWMGALFPTLEISTELYSIAQIAVVILLFVAGLETDLHQFLRYGGPAAAVALGGIIVPFLLGAYGTVLFGFAESLWAPEPLFIGAVMTATSVGITARVLGDIKKLDSPEGVTTLAGAVVDDVLGILVLTIVVAVAATGGITFSEIAAIGGKAIGFWLGLMLLGILLAPAISRILLSFRVPGATLGLALALGFLAAALAESFGLAMIIGAYTIGLALSNTNLRSTLERPLMAVYYAFVPIFFVVMGMLVNLGDMRESLVFGIAISLLAIVGKVGGCALPALGVGFNRWGALRIGLGMLPRGEVALIIAGVGLGRGVIGSDIFGVAVMMTVVTTLLAPILLVPAFTRGGAGKRS